MKIRTAKILLFAALGLCMYQGVCCVLEPRSVDVLHMRYLDKLEPDSVDVLFLGNSHVYSGIDPAVFWEEQGIPSFGMGSSGQPVYSTYFRLVEFLKTQKPKLVVIDLHGIAWDAGPPVGHTLDMLNNLGWRFSRNKLDLFNEAFKRSGWTRYLDFMLELPVYHSRYAVQSGDKSVLTDEACTKGYLPSALVAPAAPAEVLPTAEKAALHPETAVYFRKILECARERGFDLLFTVIPYRYDTADQQKVYNHVESIGGEEDFRVVDYVRGAGEIGLNFKTDFRDDGAHLNTLGATKISRHLARYIKREYILPDRRKEPAYAEWNGWAERMRRNYVSAFNKAHPDLGLK